MISGEYERGQPPNTFAHDLFGKPLHTPHQVRGRLFPDHASRHPFFAMATANIAMAPATPPVSA